jgi:phosphocarrier protein
MCESKPPDGVAAATLTVINRLGLHARAAAKFVQTAQRFAAAVTVTRDGKEVNGKSIMGVMMLAAAQGAEIGIRIEGCDADAALVALSALIADRFGEPT